MGLTDVTSPLTCQLARVAANPFHSVELGIGVGFIVSDAGRSFRFIAAGIVTRLFGALL